MKVFWIEHSATMLSGSCLRCFSWIMENNLLNEYSCQNYCFVCHHELIQLAFQTCIFIFLRNTKGECLKICTGRSFPCKNEDSKMPKLDHVTLYLYIISFLKPTMGVNQILSHYLLIIIPSSKLLSTVTGWSELNSRT